MDLVEIDVKLCGHCKNFMGGGDWSLCCSKKHGLCVSLSSAENCECYEYDETKDCLFKCPYCGEWTEYYYPFPSKNPYNVQTKDGKMLKIERYWKCNKCNKAIKAILVDKDGNKYLTKAEKVIE